MYQSTSSIKGIYSRNSNRLIYHVHIVHSKTCHGSAFFTVSNPHPLREIGEDDATLTKCSGNTDLTGKFLRNPSIHHINRS